MAEAKAPFLQRAYWKLFAVLVLLCLLQIFDLVRGRSGEAFFGLLFLVSPASLAMTAVGILDVCRPPPHLPPGHRMLRLAALALAAAALLTCANLWLSYLVAQGWIDLPVIIRF